MKAKVHTGPFILALETATDIGSVAVFSGNALLGSIEIRKSKSHARLLTPMVRDLLKELEIPTEKLAAIGVGKGPGSYTGLRVGVSTAKGLCMALNIPLLSISSLEALAWKAKSTAEALDAQICPMIDARRMEVYCGRWDKEIQVLSRIEAKIIDERSFQEELAQKKIIFLGDGAKKCETVLGKHPHAIFLSDNLSSAADMGIALEQKFKQKEFEDLVTFEPFYLKDFVATKPKDPLRETRK